MAADPGNPPHGATASTDHHPSASWLAGESTVWAPSPPSFFFDMSTVLTPILPTTFVFVYFFSFGKRTLF